MTWYIVLLRIIVKRSRLIHRVQSAVLVEIHTPSNGRYLLKVHSYFTATQLHYRTDILITYLYKVAFIVYCNTPAVPM